MRNIRDRLYIATFCEKYREAIKDFGVGMEINHTCISHLLDEEGDKRQKLLDNEFTFGYLDGPTAPGQFSAQELKELGDDCRVVGITGNPVTHSKSPKMQNAAIKAAGINAIYLRFGSPDLAHMRDVMQEYDIQITTQELLALRTAGDIAALIERKRG